MGESFVAASNEEDKHKGSTITSKPALSVSVSFGRFEHDILCWEKWSTFSQNKYLEEVEKCATPGFVARKKAYFEAHYKKVATRKGEMQDLVRQSVGGESNGDLTTETSVTDTKLDFSIAQTCVEPSSRGTEVEDELSDGLIDNNNEDETTCVEDAELITVELREVLGGVRDNIALYKTDVTLNSEDEFPFVDYGEMEEFTKSLEVENGAKESGSVEKEQNPSVGHQESIKLSRNLAKEVETVPVQKNRTLKSEKPENPQKIGVAREVTQAKKKPTTSESKVAQITKPRISKPALAPTASTSSESSTKKIINSSLPRNRIPTAGQSKSKKMAAKSLHASLSLDASTFDPARCTASKKSLATEKVKDKDTVKRALKTLHNNVNPLKASTEVKAFRVKQQMPARGTEVKVSSSRTREKENGRPHIVGPMDKKTAKAAPSSSMDRDGRTERSREPPNLAIAKKLDHKSLAKKVESTCSQERKDAEIKKLRKSQSFKATPLPGFYRAQKVNKDSLDKVGEKTFGM